MEQKTRHKILFFLLRVLAAPFIRLRMRYKHTLAKNAPYPALIVSNHVTDLDPALVGMCFKRNTYFVASEHTARFGFASKVLRFVFSPIMRIKGKTDAKSGIQILRVLKKGHSVCVFAEGNRSYSGLTGDIFAATGKLAKASGVSLVTFRIEGGYFTAPRWAKKMRRGPMRGGVVRVYTPKELKAMSADEVNDCIRRDIHEDAYAKQAQNPVRYKGKALAEYIETVFYLCPNCNRIGTLHSENDTFSCDCGLCGEYDEYGYISGSGFTFKTVPEWYTWQKEKLRGMLMQNAARQDAVITDEEQKLYSVQPAQNSTLLDTDTLRLFTDALRLGTHTFKLSEVSELAIVGRQTLVLATTEGALYEIKSEKPRSALKYLHAYEILIKLLPSGQNSN